MLPGRHKQTGLFIAGVLTTKMLHGTASQCSVLGLRPSDHLLPVCLTRIGATPTNVTNPLFMQGATKPQLCAEFLHLLLFRHVTPLVYTSTADLVVGLGDRVVLQADSPKIPEPRAMSRSLNAVYPNPK